MPRKYRTWLVWLPIVGVALIPTVFFFGHLGERAFVAATMGNWFATMVGVLVGIPIAVRLAMWQQEQRQKREDEKEQAESRSRKSRILNLVREELEFNRNKLSEQPVEPDSPFERVISAGGLKDELWRAFSDGGELEWIDDLDLMSILAQAYHCIRRVIFLQDLYLNFRFMLERHSLFTDATRIDFRDDFAILDELALHAANDAIASIDDYLALPGQPGEGSRLP